MSRYVLTAYSLHALRALALALTCVASGTFVLYATDDPRLAQLDVWLEDQRFGEAYEALQAALQPGTDPAHAKTEFQRLRTEFEGYRQGDRQEAIWMYATLMLAQQSRGAGELDQALAFATELRQSRPQDLTFQFLYADLLRATGDPQGSDRVLEDLFARIPEHGEIAQRTTQAALHKQRWLQAGLTLNEHLRKPPSLDFWVKYQTANQDPVSASLQRCPLFMRLDDTGQLSTRFAVPAGATRVELQRPLGATFALHGPRFVGELPTGTTQPASTTPGDAAAPDPSMDVPPALEFAQPLTTSLELQFVAGLTYRLAPWLQAVLVSPAFAPMQRALLDADLTQAAANLDLYRRFALWSQQQKLTSTGPDGPGEHNCQLRGGWPDAQHIECCIDARIDRPLTSLEILWPLTPQTNPAQMPRLETTPPTAPPKVVRNKDKIRFEWAEPQEIRRVQILGELRP